MGSSRKYKRNTNHREGRVRYQEGKRGFVKIEEEFGEVTTEFSSLTPISSLRLSALLENDRLLSQIIERTGTHLSKNIFSTQFTLHFKNHSVKYLLTLTKKK